VTPQGLQRAESSTVTEGKMPQIAVIFTKESDLSIDLLLFLLLVYIS